MGKVKTKVYNLGKKRKLTLAFKTIPNGGLAQLNFGVAISNPDDKQDKALGIVIATNRLEHYDSNNHELWICFENCRFIPAELQEKYADITAEVIKANLKYFVKGL